MELLLSKEVLSVIAIAGPVGIVVVILAIIVAFLFNRYMELESKKTEEETKNRQEFRNLVQRQQENDSKHAENNSLLLKTLQEIREQSEHEKKLTELAWKDQRMTVLNHATRAIETNNYVIECPNCKYKALATKDNVEKIIKEVEY